ncbi:MAG: glycosyltransferase family 2 protein [Chloroflexota bacterium]
MKISIVTLSFNQGKFLEEAILSVLDQDHPVEYIVVDPGSTDDSRQIIEKYWNRIAHVIYEPDNGPADGLNKGFSHATGTILGFLNADDFLLPGAVSHIAECFVQNPHTDVVSGHGIAVDASGKEIRKIYSDEFSLIPSAYGMAILVQPSTFFKADIYRKTNGFNTNNKTNWDDELFVDIKLQNGNFSRTNKFLSAYRIHPSGITGGASNLVHENIRNYASARFRKIMGRDVSWYDFFALQWFRTLKYIHNPLNVYERLKYGSVYRRYYEA